MAILEDEEHGGTGGALAHGGSHHPAPPTGPGADKKRDRRNQSILIVVGIVGVLVTFMLYRRSSSSSSSTTTPAPVNGTLAGVSNGQDPYAEQQSAANANALSQLAAADQSYQSATSSALSGFQTMLQNMAGQIASLSSSGTAPPQAPPRTMAGAPSGMVGQLVAEVQQPGGGVDYVTNVGAVYSVGGAKYYGGTNAGNPAGIAGAGTITGAQPLAGGGYSLVNSSGQTYNFGPLAGQAH